MEVRRHVARRGRLGEAADHERRQRVGRQRRRGEGGGPLRARHALREEALGQARPGDLRDERVEARRTLVAQLAEGADELVAASVGPADRAEHRVAGLLLLNPRLSGDDVDDLLDVLALDVGVLDVGPAAALPEAALVEAQHPEAGVGEVGERGRVRRTAPAPAVAVQHHRHRLVLRGAGRTEQREADVHRCGRARVRDAGQATVGRGDGVRGCGGRGDVRDRGEREDARDGGGDAAGEVTVHGFSPATGSLVPTSRPACGYAPRQVRSPHRVRRPGRAEPCAVPVVCIPHHSDRTVGRDHGLTGDPDRSATPLSPPAPARARPHPRDGVRRRRTRRSRWSRASGRRTPPPSRTPGSPPR